MVIYLIKENRDNNIIPPSDNEHQQAREYSGDDLIITTDSCSSGLMDIHILAEDNTLAPNKFMNYTKPRWNGGMWNFNAFRNININPNSYIFGKYFSLEFRFNSIAEIEIEAIEVNVKQFK